MYINYKPSIVAFSFHLKASNGVTFCVSPSEDPVSLTNRGCCFFFHTRLLFNKSFLLRETDRPSACCQRTDFSLEKEWASVSPFCLDGGGGDSPGVCLFLCLNFLRLRRSASAVYLQSCDTGFYLTDAGQIVFANNSFLFLNHLKCHPLHKARLTLTVTVLSAVLLGPGLCI